MTVVGRYVDKVRRWRQERCEERRRTYDLLERELEKLMPEFEALSYEDIRSESEACSISKIIGGREVWFDGEIADQKKDGTILFCINARALGAHGAGPSRLFYKRPDGSVRR